jgi:glutamate-1-semialdehyde 2,1-aminomutase
MTIEEEYQETRKKSKSLYDRAGKVMPSGIEHDSRFIRPFPFYVERAEGAIKWDTDGNELIDLWSGHGALVLGHNPPSVVTAVTQQIKRGFHYSSCHELSLKLAELIVKLLPSAEEVRYMQSGTEANMLAIRVARAYTGKNKIIKFRGHFHGYWNEGVVGVRPPYEAPMSIGVPKESMGNVLLADHNDSEQVLRLTRENDDIACVIMDPTGHAFILPFNPEFIKEIRRITEDKGVLLIFDEVISGFRYGPHGVQGIVGVTPDLTTLAKTIGGGLPLSAVAGKKHIMELISFTDDQERNRYRRVISQGTHSGNPVVCAAGLAYLMLLADGEPQRYINTLGTMLRKGMNEVIKKHDIVGCVHGRFSTARSFLSHDCPYLGKCDGENCHCPDLAKLDAGSPLKVRRKLHLAMLLNGVDYSGGGTGTMFLNAGLTDQDIEKVIHAFDQSLARLKMEKVV